MIKRYRRDILVMTKANGRKPKNIKHHNLRYILSIVKRHGVCTAGEIDYTEIDKRVKYYERGMDYV